MRQGRGYGARAELERLYRDGYERFLRVAVAIVRDESAAHDAVQDGFARALKGLKGFDGSGSFDGWVWRIVVNAALAVRRAQVPAASEIESVELLVAADDDGVRGWVARLPERQRLVVFLRYYADLDYRSIASALEVEVGTVSATLSAAHTSLRRQLREVRR